MKMNVYLVKFIFTLLLAALDCGALQGSVCIAKIPKDGCLQNEFRCSDGTCIDRRSYCDGLHDCEDYSDEDCSFDEQCRLPDFRRCELSNTCIPIKWFCDGVSDCEFGEDEICEEKEAKENALRWLKMQRLYRSTTDVWGSSIDRIAVAFYLGDSSWRYLNDGTRSEMAYELSIQLLSRLSREKLENIPSTDLASYVNAFLVTCLNPRDFHGLDLVQELRSRVGLYNYTNPYLFLALCNAGEAMEETDIEQLMDAFENKRRPLWTDIKALVVMALACANRTTEDLDVPHLSNDFLEQLWSEATDNLRTKALVIQAIISAGYYPLLSNETEVLRKAIAAQDSSGSFGNIVNNYYMLPVLNCQSLADISSDHCKTFYKNDTLNRDTPLDKGPRITVSYSIRLGHDGAFTRQFVLKVPANTTLFKLTQHAADLDGHRLEYVYQHSKPYITAVYGEQDDPEKGKFWFLYSSQDDKLVPIHDSPADIIIKDEEIYLLWYHNENWTDNSTMGNYSLFNN